MSLVECTPAVAVGLVSAGTSRHVQAPNHLSTKDHPDGCDTLALQSRGYFSSGTRALGRFDTSTVVLSGRRLAQNKDPGSN